MGYLGSVASANPNTTTNKSLVVSLYTTTPGEWNVIYLDVVTTTTNCPPGAAEFEEDPCGRCSVLGRRANVEVER